MIGEYGDESRGFYCRWSEPVLETKVKTEVVIKSKF